MFSLIVGIRLVIFFVSPSLFILFYAPLIKVRHMSLFLLSFFFFWIKKSNFKWKIKSNTTHYSRGNRNRISDKQAEGIEKNKSRRRRIIC